MVGMTSPSPAPTVRSSEPASPVVVLRDVSKLIETIEPEPDLDGNRTPSKRNALSARQAGEQALADARRGDYGKAVEGYAEALKAAPAEAVELRMALLNNKGAALDSLGKLDEAIADYTQAIAINPNQANAANAVTAATVSVLHFNRGNAYAQKAELDEAIADYTQAIAINPGSAAAYNNRGCAHIDKQDYASAIDDLTQATELSPDDVKAHKNLREAVKHCSPYELRSLPGQPAPPPNPFLYVADSLPSELAGNVDRAIQAVMPSPGVVLDESGQLARDLCVALDSFLWPVPPPERVAAFLGVFKPMVAFLKLADDQYGAYCADGHEPALVEAARLPFGQLCRTLFRAHRESLERGYDPEATLLECLGEALAAYQDSDGYRPGKSAVVGLMAVYAQGLFAIDPDWTETHLLRHLSKQSPYQRVAADGLLHSGYWLQPEFMLAVQARFLELMADMEDFWKEPVEQGQVCRWLHQIGSQALRTGDTVIIAQTQALLKVLSEAGKIETINALCYVFGDEDDEPDADELADQQQVPEFIAKLFPDGPEFRFEWATVHFVGLVMAAKEHAPDVYETCKQLLVPVRAEPHAHHLFMKLGYVKRRFYLFENHPEIAADIIARTGILDSVWGEKLKPLIELPLAEATG